MPRELSGRADSNDLGKNVPSADDANARTAGDAFFTVLLGRLFLQLLLGMMVII